MVRFNSLISLPSILITGVLLLLASLFFLNRQIDEVEEWYGEVERLEKQVKRMQHRVAPLVLARERYGRGEGNYLDRHLATLPATKHSSTSYSRPVTLLHDAVRLGDWFRETEIILGHPLHLTLPGIEQLLCLVEGVSINKHQPPHPRPQIIVKRFSLRREWLPDRSEGYWIDLSLVQREYFEKKV